MSNGISKCIIGSKEHFIDSSLCMCIMIKSSTLTIYVSSGFYLYLVDIYVPQYGAKCARTHQSYKSNGNKNVEYSTDINSKSTRRKKTVLLPNIERKAINKFSDAQPTLLISTDFFSILNHANIDSNCAHSVRLCSCLVCCAA